MKDLLAECMADWHSKTSQMGPKSSKEEFQGLFCRACRNVECVHHQAGDPFSDRMGTQFERLTNPLQADPRLPKYANLVDFASALQEALRLEISERRGDWTVPSFDVTDGEPVSSSADVVDEAVRKLKRAPERDEEVWARARALAGKKGDVEEYVAEIYRRLMSGVEVEPLDDEDEPPPPAPAHPKATAPPTRMGNAPAQGGMVSGEEPPPQADPWAVPVDPEKVGGRMIKHRATIRFSSDGGIEDGSS